MGRYGATLIPQRSLGGEYRPPPRGAFVSPSKCGDYSGEAPVPAASLGSPHYRLRPFSLWRDDPFHSPAYSTASVDSIQDICIGTLEGYCTLFLPP